MKFHNKEVSVLVVTHNHEDFISELILSLEKLNYSSVYFCEANSKDNTLKLLQESRYKDNILVKKSLESYSKNNNDLIRHFNIKSDYFLLLNPDTFFSQDFISPLVKYFLNHDNVAITTPLVRYPDGRIQVTWKKFPRLLTVLKKRLGILTSIEENQMKGPKIDWCLGACMLISNVLLKKDNTLLDERYRLYCEDIDICFECSQKGFFVHGVEECHIYHNLGEKSAKNILSKYNYWNVASILMFITKWNVRYFRQLNKN